LPKGTRVTDTGKDNPTMQEKASARRDRPSLWRRLSIRTLIFLVMGMLVALVVAILAVTTADVLANKRTAAHNLKLAEAYRNLFIARERVRVVQGAVSASVDYPTPLGADMRLYISQAKGRADAALAAAMETLAQPEFESLAPRLDRIRTEHDRFDRAYAKAWAQIQVGRKKRDPGFAEAWAAQAIALMTDIELQSDILGNEIQTTDSFLVEMNKLSAIAWAVRDSAGQDRRHVGIVLAHGLTPADLSRFSATDGRIDGAWGALEPDMRLPTIPPAILDAKAKAQDAYFGALRKKRKQLLAAAAKGEPAAIDGYQWWQISEPALTSLAGVAVAALDLSQAHAAALAAQAQRDFYATTGAMALLLAFSLLVFFVIVTRVIRPLGRITETIQSVAAGRLTVEIPFADQGDEIGRLARALEAFRDNALEMQRLEIELIENRLAKETAETSAKMRTRFFANMSHELRTPLNAIIGFSDLMEQKLFGPLDARYQDYARLIHKSGRHLLDLVCDILDMSKIEAGKLTLHFEPVDLAEIIDDCLVMVGERAHEGGVVLAPDLPERLPLTADARAVKQVVLNILSNAVKFTRPGGRVDISAGFAPNGNARISIRDTGIGIPAAALTRIGHAFEQVSNDPTLAREGAGLGLSLVRALVEHHGGRFHIDSVEHVGTSVTVDFPLSQPSTKAA
jgi:signal transduction histidine kinase